MHSGKSLLTLHPSPSCYRRGRTSSLSKGHVGLQVQLVPHHVRLVQVHRGVSLALKLTKSTVYLLWARCRAEGWGREKERGKQRPTQINIGLKDRHGGHGGKHDRQERVSPRETQKETGMQRHGQRETYIERQGQTETESGNRDRGKDKKRCSPRNGN